MTYHGLSLAFAHGLCENAARHGGQNRQARGADHRELLCRSPRVAAAERRRKQRRSGDRRDGTRSEAASGRIRIYRPVAKAAGSRRAVEVSLARAPGPQRLSRSQWYRHGAAPAVPRPGGCLQGYFNPKLIKGEYAFSGFDAVPRFRYREEPARDQARWLGVDALGLLIPALLAALLAGLALRRYPVVSGQ